MAGEEPNDEFHRGRVKQQNAVARSDATTALQIPGQRTNLIPQLRISESLLVRFHVRENECRFIRALGCPVLKNRDKVIPWRNLVAEKLVQVQGGNSAGGWDSANRHGPMQPM